MGTAAAGAWVIVQPLVLTVVSGGLNMKIVIFTFLRNDCLILAMVLNNLVGESKKKKITTCILTDPENCYFYFLSMDELLVTKDFPFYIYFFNFIFLHLYI